MTGSIYWAEKGAKYLNGLVYGNVILRAIRNSLGKDDSRLRVKKMVDLVLEWWALKVTRVVNIIISCVEDHFYRAREFSFETNLTCLPPLYMICNGKETFSCISLFYIETSVFPNIFF